jgi:hypothetical protein
MEKKDKLITIYKAANQIEAELIKGLLESEDIPALLKYESLGQVYGLTIDGLGQVEVQVPLKYAQKAETLVNNMQEIDEDEEPGQPGC